VSISSKVLRASAKPEYIKKNKLDARDESAMTYRKWVDGKRTETIGS
jgi:hypothetical protein